MLQLQINRLQQKLLELWRWIERYLFDKRVWRKRITFWEAVSLMIGATIGAGLLGIPYAVSQVGFLVGVFYILAVGGLIIGVNLLLGEVSTRTSGNFQVVGLANRYLGKGGKYVMMLLFYLEVFGILTIYLIGEGQILASMFGGNAGFWSVIFWFAGAVCVYYGLNAVKKVETFLTLVIFLIVMLIAAYGLPAINMASYEYYDLSAFFLPYGVILFSLSGISTVPSAYLLLKGKNKMFKQAIVTSSVISLTIYLIFLTVVLGVTGAATTEIATIGLGKALGEVMFYVANTFAVLAMTTSFIMLAMALRDSLSWDFGMSYRKANAVALLAPLIIFLLGVRGFVAMIDLVGGVLMSLQMFMIVFIYWRAKQLGDVQPVNYRLHHTFLIAMLTLAAFSFGAAYSIYGIFI